MQSCIDQLLDEEDRAGSSTDERRSVARTPFVRPVRIVTGRQETHDGCSRDISKNGIAIMTRSEWKPSTIATLAIHSLKRRPDTVKAEVRWCQPFGEGWYVSGWRFIS
jgi:hypothetical protein